MEANVEAFVQKMLDDLKVGLEAIAVALIDEYEGKLRLSTETPPAGFWNAVSDLACLDVQWAHWNSELWRCEEHRVACGCGQRHELYGLGFHNRWILMIIGQGTPVPGVARKESEWVVAQPEAVFSRVTRLLRYTLPSEGLMVRSSNGNGADPAEIAMPLWWVRRIHN
jgi:hypothetical protein